MSSRRGPGLDDLHATTVTAELTRLSTGVDGATCATTSTSAARSPSVAEEPPDPEHFDQAEEAFSAPRYQRLYRRWVTNGDGVFDLAAEGLKHVLDSGAGRIETVVLPHQYRHLAPIVHTDYAQTTGGREGRRDRRNASAPVDSCVGLRPDSQVSAPIDRPQPAK